MHASSPPAPATWGDSPSGGLSPAALAPIPTATGSLLLQRTYKSSLARGLAIAALVHGAGLSLYWGVVAGDRTAPARREIALTYVTVSPPFVAPPPAGPDAPPPAVPATAAAGIPDPVPDPDVAPDRTIASPPDGGRALPGPGTPGGVVERAAPAAHSAPPVSPRPEPDPPAPQVFEVAEQMPELIGGLASIRPAYPELDRRAGNEGRVFLQFIVNEDGSVTDVVVTRGVSPGLDRAAVEAVRHARFRPGMQRGRAVRVRFSLPVHFRLN